MKNLFLDESFINGIFPMTDRGGDGGLVVLGLEICVVLSQNCGSSLLWRSDCIFLLWHFLFQLLML